MVSLGSVAEFINGVAFKPSDWGEEGKKIVRIQNLTDPEKPFNRTTREVESKYVIHPGDLLVSWSATLGVFTWDDEETAIVNQHIFRVEPDEDVVDRSYLRHMLADALLDMERHLHGATMKHVNRSEFLSTQIPLPHKNGKPDLDEQKRIAALLDKADALRRKRQEALRLTDDFLRSTFLDLFGSPSSPKCPRVPLGPLIQFMTSGGRGWARYYSEAGQRFIRSTDVRMNYIGDDDAVFVQAPDNAEALRTKVQAHDVLLTITGSLIGRSSAVPPKLEGSFISQHVAILRLSPGLPPEFVAWCLSMDEGQQQIQKLQSGQTKPGLNFDQIRKIHIPHPSENDTKRFLRVVEKMNTAKLKAQRHLEEAETLFSALQQRAFNGEL